MRPPVGATTEAVRPRLPFTVERYPSTADTVLLVGYDSAGLPAVELRVPSNRYEEAQIDGLRLLVKGMQSPPEAGNPSAPVLSVIRGGMR